MIRFQQHAIVSIALGAVFAFGCGESKPAQAPGCPAGTVLRGEDCIPGGESKEETPSPKKADEAEAPAESASAEEAPKPSAKVKPAAEEEHPAASAGEGDVHYDKEMVHMVLHRAALQVAAHCGAATDESGKAGPWGKTRVTITLGRNGYTRKVEVAPDFDGKPAGNCIVQGFRKLAITPYNAPTDEQIVWPVNIKKP